MVFSGEDNFKEPLPSVALMEWICTFEYLIDFINSATYPFQSEVEKPDNPNLFLMVSFNKSRLSDFYKSTWILVLSKYPVLVLSIEPIVIGMIIASFNIQAVPISCKQVILL